ncbi:hypothetical protein QYE76_067726 [Lolium multiflorum]|uniref:Transposase (putative) gypsy type domain-containing protein n=1 Tax=Lolium multiflorum TaxID=4521 RepID=A0AAD8WB02_LOLMU|nr:hypothetical protein QYE76_067726 [Lolium multiflorum]
MSSPPRSSRLHPAGRFRKENGGVVSRTAGSRPATLSAAAARAGVASGLPPVSWAVTPAGPVGPPPGRWGKPTCAPPSPAAPQQHSMPPSHADVVDIVPALPDTVDMDKELATSGGSLAADVPLPVDAAQLGKTAPLSLLGASLSSDKDDDKMLALRMPLASVDGAVSGSVQGSVDGKALAESCGNLSSAATATVDAPPTVARPPEGLLYDPAVLVEGLGSLSLPPVALSGLAKVSLPADDAMLAPSLVWVASLCSDDDGDDEGLAPQPPLAPTNSKIPGLVRNTSDVRHDEEAQAGPYDGLSAATHVLGDGEDWYRWVREADLAASLHLCFGRKASSVVSPSSIGLGGDAFGASSVATRSAHVASPSDSSVVVVLVGGSVSVVHAFPPLVLTLRTLIYGLQPHNISPNSVLAISNHVTLCEGHLRVAPDLALFQYYFSVKKEKIPKASELATCGSITFMLRPGRVYPPTDRHESARYWSGGFFYLKDVSDPASERADLQADRGGSDGKDLTMSWFTKRIQPLQHMDPLMFQYTGRDDPMRASKDNLSSDAIDKRIRLLIKIPRDLHVHVCNKDIHTNDSGTALEALEEGDLGTLLRVPHAGNTDPEAASEAEAPEAPRPSKRKRAAPSSPSAKRAREVLNTAATRKAEAEKKRLKLIDTSNRAQPEIHQFFRPSGSSQSQPPKAPKAPKKKTKPSPASIPVTPEVGVPPKASSAAKPDPKDVINIDDIPEDPTTETGQGDSGKGASSSVPPPEQPTATSAEPTAEQYEQKVQLIRATGASQTPSLQKLPLSQRHAEISAMMEKVWGPADTEMKELSDLESDLKVFFAKHKEVRQGTRKLHEDLRVHVLEQMTEIEGLRQTAENSRQAVLRLETRLKEETDKRPTIDALSAKIQVLEAENETLKNFLKESSEKETKEKKELSEKHSREMAELADKLKKSHQRVTTLAARNKSQEAEAEAIDKLIFPSLGFEWTKESTLKRTEAYDEARSSIEDLVEACRGIAKALNLKRAKTTMIDRMTKLMRNVPELIKDWQESSSRGVAALVLAAKRTSPP